MKVTQLNLTNFRAYESLKLEFEPDLTVIAGINGVGKSTALEVIAKLLSQKLTLLTSSTSKPLLLEFSDIKYNKEFFEVNLNFTMSDNKEFQVSNYYYYNKEKKSISLGESLKLKIKKKYNDLAVYYSVNRASLVIPRSSGKHSMSTQKAAYERALNGDRIDLKNFIALYNYQKSEALNRENINKTIENAIYSLMYGFTSLEVLSEPKPTLKLKKGNEVLDVSDMSDGERNVLAMTIDLARRLAIANPESENPLQEGKAVVLIDEIELHLHPKWQRTILSCLLKTFPNCQFIVTTHSPQILGEVEARCIRYLSRDTEGKVICDIQTESYGKTSDRILEELMNVRSRNDKVADQILDLFRKIEWGQIKESKVILEELKKYIPSESDIIRAEFLIKHKEITGK